MSNSLLELGYEPPRGQECRVVAQRLAVIGVSLLLLSTVVILLGAAESPYHYPIITRQAIMQVGIAIILIIAWIVWVGMLLLRIKQQRIPSVLAVAVILPAIVSFYLVAGIIGYITDLKTNVFVPLTPSTIPPVTTTYPTVAPPSPKTLP